jgi:tetratricopeptide (TPR) repeat protein
MANPSFPTSSSGSNDLISDSMTRLATTASKQRKLVLVAAVIFVAAALAASLYLTKRNAFRAQGSEALFKARQTLNDEMKAVAQAMKPAAPAAKVDPKKAKDAKAPAEAAASAADIQYSKFEVDEKLKGGVAALERVADEFGSTMAGFDARMQLGSLYYDHATSPAAYEKAAQWFEKASASAPSREQGASALYSLGYAQESLGRCGDAVKTFDRALASGASYVLGDLLRAQGRCYVTLGDKENAKRSYDRLIKEMPNSDDSRFAESRKAAL